MFFSKGLHCLSYLARALQIVKAGFVTFSIVLSVGTTVKADTLPNADSAINTHTSNDSALSINADNLPAVASINLCADQLVLLLAEPRQILSLSNLSHDKAGSFFYEQARKYPVNTGAGEQIIKLAPDLVIAGQYTTKNTIKLLKELNMRVETIPIANTLEQLYSNIENVAQWLGHPSKGVSLVSQLRASVTQLQSRRTESSSDMPAAAYYDPNGYTVGDETLRGQILQMSGWRNVASEGGITHYGTLSLESLIRLAPDALIDSPYSVDTYSRGQRLLTHPALRASGLDPLVINIPSRQTICAGPWTVDLLERLSQERDKFLSAQ